MIKKIEVIAYSGYRGEEIPRAMIFGDERIEVAEILKRWVDEGPGDRSIKRFFRVKGSNREAYDIYYDEAVMAWFWRS